MSTTSYAFHFVLRSIIDSLTISLLLNGPEEPSPDWIIPRQLSYVIRTISIRLYLQSLIRMSILKWLGIYLSQIVEEVFNYVNAYISHKKGVFTLHPREFQRRYAFSTLPYFDRIFGITKVS